jgi:TetR/AcrR family transcriptional regulator
MSPRAKPPASDRAEDARARLIQAAITVFSRYGFRQASVELVAQEARMSRQNLYNHFASKEAIFQAGVHAMQGMTLDAALSAVEASRAAGGDAVDELASALAARHWAFVQVLRSTPHAAELVDEQGRLCREIVADGQRDFRELLLRRAQSQRSVGYLKLPRRTPTAEFVDDAMIVSLGLKYVDDIVDAADFRQRLVRLLRRLLAGANAAA